jgi:hypothetical protein
MFKIALGLVFACWWALISPLTTEAAAPEASDACSWKQIPTNYLAHQEGVSPEVRLARDAYWDMSNPSKEPITPETLAGASGDVTLGSLSAPEIAVVPNRAVVTGTFSGSRSIFTATRYAIYTEVTFRIGRVFESVDNSLAANSAITVTVPGGAVTTQDRKTIHHLTQACDMFIQPSRTYLLVLSYHSLGTFYTLRDNWDITTGTIRPNTQLGKLRVEKGLSTLNGLSVEQLDSTLPALLSQHQ